MKYEVKYTNQFRKDLKIAKKQHKDLEELFRVINILALMAVLWIQNIATTALREITREPGNVISNQTGCLSMSTGTMCLCLCYIDLDRMLNCLNETDPY